MMSDIDVEMAKVHQEIATHNSKVAADMSVKNKIELEAQVDRLNKITNTLTQQIADLQRKYNLLLSERFNTGPTDGD